MSSTTPTNELTIRPLTDGDREWVRRFVREQWHSEQMIVHDTIYEVAKLSGFIAEAGNEVVGLATYHIDGEACEIVSLDGLRRRQGIGTAFVARVAEEARQQGCRRLWLITTNDNLDALRFYQRRGFALEAVDPGALNRTRQLKPEIPPLGDYDIPIRDEIRLGMTLVDSDDGHAR